MSYYFTEEDFKFTVPDDKKIRYDYWLISEMSITQAKKNSQTLANTVETLQHSIDTIQKRDYTGELKSELEVEEHKIKEYLDNFDVEYDKTIQMMIDEKEKVRLEAQQSLQNIWKDFDTKIQQRKEQDLKSLADKQEQLDNNIKLMEEYQRAIQLARGKD